MAASLYGLSAQLVQGQSLLRVAAVRDGETIGLDLVGYVRIRGIDAPLTSECFAPESRAFLRGLLHGARVSLEQHDEAKREADILREDGLDLAEELVRLGYARAAPVAVDRYPGLSESEKEARGHKLGLWVACRP